MHNFIIKQIIDIRSNSESFISSFNFYIKQLKENKKDKQFILMAKVLGNKCYIFLRTCYIFTIIVLYNCVALETETYFMLSIWQGDVINV